MLSRQPELPFPSRGHVMGQLPQTPSVKWGKVDASSQVFANNLIATQPPGMFILLETTILQTRYSLEKIPSSWMGRLQRQHPLWGPLWQLMTENRRKHGRSMIIKRNNEVGWLVSSAFPLSTKYCFNLPKAFLLFRKQATQMVFLTQCWWQYYPFIHYKNSGLNKLI